MSIWIDEASLKQLYAEDSVIAKLRTEIQSIAEVQLVEADLDMAAEIDRLHAINAELIQELYGAGHTISSAMRGNVDHAWFVEALHSIQSTLEKSKQ